MTRPARGAMARGRCCGSHSCLNGIGMSAMRAITCSRVRMSGVAVGGSRLCRGSFINAPMHDGDVGAAGRLGTVNRQSLLWRDEFYALDAFYMQSGIQATQGDISP